MFWKVTLSLLEGFGVTCEIFALTLLFALPLGLIISFGSMSKFKPLKWLCKVVVWCIRGTPLMLQLIVAFYGPGLAGEWAKSIDTSAVFAFLDGVPQIQAIFTGVVEWIAAWRNPDRFVAVLIAFIINYSCYFSEIYRGGIEAIPVGQREAGQVLGMKKSQLFFKVTLLQVIKRIVPPMSNEIITLVKDTSLARIIAVYEVIYAGQHFIKSEGLIWPLFYTGAFYLIFCGVLTLLFGYIEKKLDYFRG